MVHEIVLWSLTSRGSHILVACRSICDRIKNLGRWKSSLITWLLHFEALDCLSLWEFKVQKHCHTRLVSEKLCWSVDISHSEVIFIPWSAPKENVDHLIPFWPRSQTLLRATCDYLEYSVFGTWLQERAFNCSSLAGQFFSGGPGEKEL